MKSNDPPIKIVYYTSGVTGSGRLVQGIAVRNAFSRKNIPVDFTILHSAPDAGILKGIPHYCLPMESVDATDFNNYHTSAVYAKLRELSPDFIIVDLLWIPVRSFLSILPGKKIFLTRQVAAHFFSFRQDGNSLTFDSSQYDKVIAVEPYDCPVTKAQVNPIVIRNPDEILEKDEACKILKINPKKRHCLFSLNAEAQAFCETAKSYTYFEEEGYQLFFSSLFSEGIFPIVDYFDAFDLVICGAGYNAFWETVYFRKKAIFIPMPKRYEDQRWRVDNCREYQFTRNGADELAEIISGR